MKYELQWEYKDSIYFKLVQVQIDEDTLVTIIERSAVRHNWILENLLDQYNIAYECDGDKLKPDGSNYESIGMGYFSLNKDGEVRHSTYIYSDSATYGIKLHKDHFRNLLAKHSIKIGR